MMEAQIEDWRPEKTRLIATVAGARVKWLWRDSCLDWCLVAFMPEVFRQPCSSVATYG